MRLDVALMRRLGLVGLRSTTTSASVKPASTSPWPNSLRSATLEGLSGLGSIAFGEDVVMEDRRVRLHRLVDVGHMRQHLVVDLDELRAPGGRRRR